MPAQPGGLQSQQVKAGSTWTWAGCGGKKGEPTVPSHSCPPQDGRTTSGGLRTQPCWTASSRLLTCLSLPCPHQQLQSSQISGCRRDPSPFSLLTHNLQDPVTGMVRAVPPSRRPAPAPGIPQNRRPVPAGLWWVTATGPSAARPDRGDRDRRQPEEAAGHASVPHMHTGHPLCGRR